MGGRASIACRSIVKTIVIYRSLENESYYVSWQTQTRHYKTAKHACHAGLTQVSKERQVPFDRLPAPAPGLKTSDPNTKHLLSLVTAPCTPYPAEQLKNLGADVR